MHCSLTFPLVLASIARITRCILEQGNHRIQILNMDLTHSSSFGVSGSGDGQFSNPYDIAFDSINNHYIVDHGNHRIQVFTPDGKFLRKFGTEGSGNGELNFPYSIAIDGNDTVYVADCWNNRIVIFTTQGQFLRSFSSRGTADGQLHYPANPDTTGYGMERSVQFYSLSQKAVVRTAALTHWATAMDVSPQGHLLAFGCQGEVIG